MRSYLSIQTLAFAKNELSFLSQSDQIKLSGFFAPSSNYSSKPCREPKLNKKSLGGKIANVVNITGKKCETSNSFDSLILFRIMNKNSFKERCLNE